MPAWNKKVYDQLIKIKNTLEKHYKEMQDIEFTVQDGVLYMLQTRTGKRTGTAAVRIAVEMVKEKLIDEKTAVKRVNPDSLNHLLQPQLDPKAKAPVEEAPAGLVDEAAVHEIPALPSDEEVAAIAAEQEAGAAAEAAAEEAAAEDVPAEDKTADDAKPDDDAGAADESKES